MSTTTRYATAIAIAGLYTALVVWLVGAEARSYRQAIRRDRDRGQAVTPALARATSPTPSKSALPAGDAVTPNTPVPTTSPRSPEPKPEPAPVIPKPEVPTAAVVATPSLAAPPLISPVPPRAPRSPGAVWADSLDLERLTPAEEARLGAELHGLVMAGNLADPNGDVQRLKRAAAPLIAKVARTEVEYKFNVLDSDEVNAFSLPGGYVYVSRGLFQLVGESVEPEQDYALQFALGHEIAHVDLKHALNLVAAGRGAGNKAQEVDTLTQFMVPIGLGYPDAQEFAADTWAYQRMTTEGEHTRREALMFLIKLQGFSERNGFRNGRLIPDPKSGLTLVENHYRAHPAAWDRLDRLKTRGVRRPGNNGSPPR